MNFLKRVCLSTRVVQASAVNWLILLEQRVDE